jgi:hypothetical protein
MTFTMSAFCHMDIFIMIFSLPDLTLHCISLKDCVCVCVYICLCDYVYVCACVCLSVYSPDFLAVLIRTICLVQENPSLLKIKIKYSLWFFY